MNVGHDLESQTVDLTGLPEPVVRSIRQLVESLRHGMPAASAATSVPSRLPLKGRFADLELSIPNEHIDETQRETWEKFGLEPDTQ